MNEKYRKKNRKWTWPKQKKVTHTQFAEKVEKYVKIESMIDWLTIDKNIKKIKKAVMYGKKRKTREWEKKQRKRKEPN